MGAAGLSTMAPLRWFFFVLTHAIASPAEDSAASIPHAMNQHLSCDECQAVTHTLTQLLVEAHRPGQFTRGIGGEVKLTDDAFYEALYDACYGHRRHPGHGLVAYRLQTIDGRSRLTGPGLVAAAELGAHESGEDWTTQLEERCPQVLQAYEEEELYEAFMDRR